MGRREKLIAKFRSIASDRLTKLNTAFTHLEKSPGDEDTFKDAAREVHSLKGEAKLLGFAPISRIAHKIEELMKRATEFGFDGSNVFVEQIFKGFDLIERLRALAPDAEEAESAAGQYQI